MSAHGSQSWGEVYRCDLVAIRGGELPIVVIVGHASPASSKVCSFREPHSLLRYDHVHRNVIRLWVNGQKRLLSITHP